MPKNAVWPKLRMPAFPQIMARLSAIRVMAMKYAVLPMLNSSVVDG